MKQAIFFIMFLGFIHPAGASDLIFFVGSDTTWQWYCNGKLLQGETNATLKGTGSGGVYNYRRTATVDGKMVGEFNITLKIPNSPSTPMPEPPTDIFEIPNVIDLQNVASAGSTCSLQILASDSWMVSSYPDWVTVTPSSGGAGKEPQSVEIKVSANPASVGRNSQIVFERKDKRTLAVAVSQKEKILVDAFALLDADGLKSVPWEGGTVNAKILSSGSWKLENFNNIMVIPSSGNASEEPQPVVIQVKPNSYYLERVDNIYFKRDDNKRLVEQVVTVAKPIEGDDFLFISNDNGYISEQTSLYYDGSIRYLGYVFSSASWSVTQDSWLKVSPSVGSGNRKGESVSIKASANDKPDARAGQVVFRRNDGKTITFKVNQMEPSGLLKGGGFLTKLPSYPSYNSHNYVSKVGQTVGTAWFGKSGVKYDFRVDQPWISCVSDNGNQYVEKRGDKINITFEPNDSEVNRKCKLTLTGSDGEVIIYGFEQQ